MVYVMEFFIVILHLFLIINRLPGVQARSVKRPGAINPVLEE